MNTPGIVPVQPGPETTPQNVLPGHDDAFADELAIAIETAPAETENPDTGTGTGDVLPPDEPRTPQPEPPNPPIAPSIPATEPGGTTEPDPNHDANSHYTAGPAGEAAVFETPPGEDIRAGAPVRDAGGGDHDPTPAEPPASSDRGTHRSLEPFAHPPPGARPPTASGPSTGLPDGAAPHDAPDANPIVPAPTAPGDRTDPMTAPKARAPASPSTSPDEVDPREAFERFDAFTRLTRTRNGRAEMNLGGREGHLTVSVQPDAGEVFLTARLTSRSLLEAFDASAQELADALTHHGLHLAGFDTGAHDGRTPPNPEHDPSPEAAEHDVAFADGWRRPKIVA